MKPLNASVQDGPHASSAMFYPIKFNGLPRNTYNSITNALIEELLVYKSL